MVDVTYKQDIEPAITREEIKKVKILQEMVLFKNSRLSVQPVSAKEWKTVLNLRSPGN
jgi:predicted RNA-binding protein with PUA-like domain